MAPSFSQRVLSRSRPGASGELTVKRPMTVSLALVLGLGVLLPGCVLVAIMYYTTAHSADKITGIANEGLRARCVDQLVAIREIKRRQLEDYFSTLTGQLHAIKDRPWIRERLVEFDKAFMDNGDSVDSDAWRALAKKYDSMFEDICDDFGQQDMLLMCPEGSIVYTTGKESELGLFVDQALLKNSPLGKVFQELQADPALVIAFSDFEPHAPSNNAPAAFAMARIKDDKGGVVGHVAFRIGFEKINHIMAERAGMGESGETYLVGADKLMRSDSFLDPTNHSVVASFASPSSGSADTEVVNAALKGERGEKVIINYTGNSVLSAYTPVDLLGTRWALLAEIDEAEAFAAIHDLQQFHENASRSLAIWTSVLSGVCFLSLVLVGFWIHRKIARPIRRVALAARAAADGNLDVETATGGKSEVAVLGQAFNEMISNLKSMVAQIESAGSKVVSASREQAKGAKNQSVATEEMASTVTELLASAKKMAENAGSVAEQAGLASNECISGMTNVEGAVQGIKSVHERVEKIAAHMVELGGKSQQISGVLDIITELSEQTNLLSLNASIEAAGAGEAGKRFAVVASEIRKLAERATDSTGEIRSLIDGVQETVNATIMATEEGTKAAEEGVRLTEEVDGSFGCIAKQVASTTKSAKAIEMGSRQQATAIEQMESAVRSIDTAAQQTAENARQLDTDSQALLETARQLRRTEQELQAV